jgi:monofunctional biosynthetic peptidoglycan transglycosylase
MRWLLYPVKCLLAGFVAMQIFFALQIALWIGLDPSTTAFQRAERWRICAWHWSCSVKSQWVPYDKISNNLKRAVLVSEDDIFFQHKGVRVEDMQKAWQKNQQKTQAGNKAKTVLRGGSTITQQRLLEIYLNSVEWGEGIFGVGAASQRYYATNPSNLDRDQAAALASALPAPKCFDKQQYCRRGSINYAARQEFILENMERVALSSNSKGSSGK